MQMQRAGLELQFSKAGAAATGNGGNGTAAEIHEQQQQQQNHHGSMVLNRLLRRDIISAAEKRWRESDFLPTNTTKAPTSSGLLHHPKTALACSLIHHGCLPSPHNPFSDQELFSVPANLDIFPSWVDTETVHHRTPVLKARSKGEGASTGSGSGQNTVCKAACAAALVEKKRKAEAVAEPIGRRPSHNSLRSSDRMEGNSSRTDTSNDLDKDTKQDSNRRGRTSSSEQEASKTLDAKTLRRLAQNREAARKSRLRKKAYVQQLESSRIKLNQLEQHLQQARAQGFLIGTGFLGEQGPHSAGAAAFEMEYARWVEDQRRIMCELGAAYHTHITDNELRVIVDNCLAHFDEKFRLKSIAAKADVFHVVSGMWKTPAERCYMWMGGFRPSELIKILVSQLEPFTDQQLMGIYNLQHSSQQAEEALSQGMESLQHSLTQSIVSSSLINPPPDYMAHIAIAVDKLANLEGFVRQADNLRQETLHQLHRILTTRQMARCFMSIGEYFNRLRALSFLFSDRLRQTALDGSTSTATLVATNQSSNYFSTL